MLTGARSGERDELAISLPPSYAVINLGFAVEGSPDGIHRNPGTGTNKFRSQTYQDAPWLDLHANIQFGEPGHVCAWAMVVY